MKGIIALDIDGTLTAERYHVPLPVKDFLAGLNAAGWSLIFLTGRPFAWGWESTKDFDFPYFLAVQNGALILEMPAQKICARHYLQISMLPEVEKVLKPFLTGYVIYGGFERNDVCYYKPQHFQPTLLEYLEIRRKMVNETWIALENEDEWPIKDFPSIKCFAKEKEAQLLHTLFESELGLHAPAIRDPLNSAYYVVQATTPEADKGEALKSFIKQMNHKGPVIAAGDDTNDIPMFKVATLSVALGNAPQSVLDAADIRAPSVHEQGIVSGLTEALRRIKC